MLLFAKNLIDEQFPIISPDEKISKVIAQFENHDVVIVMEDNDYQGVISKKDIIKPKLNLNAKVKTFLRHPPVLKPNDTIEEIIRVMFENEYNTLPVNDKNKIKGIVTIDRLLKEIQNRALAETTVNYFMSNKLITIDSNEGIGKAIKLLSDQNISCLPVYENNKITGILTMDDIINKTIHPEHKAKGWAEYGELIAEKKQYLNLPVKSIMNESLNIVKPTTKVNTVIDKMLKFNLNSLLIGDGNKLEGIITKKDLLESLIITKQENDMGKVIIQFAGELKSIENFSKKQGIELLNNIIKKYETFLENGHLVVYLKQHDETKKGKHLIYSKIRLYSTKGIFIASDTGWNFLQALKNTVSKIERQIKKNEEIEALKC